MQRCATGLALLALTCAPLALAEPSRGGSPDEVVYAEVFRVPPGGLRALIDKYRSKYPVALTGALAHPEVLPALKKRGGPTGDDGAALAEYLSRVLEKDGLPRGDYIAALVDWFDWWWQPGQAAALLQRWPGAKFVLTGLLESHTRPADAHAWGLLTKADVDVILHVAEADDRFLRAAINERIRRVPRGGLAAEFRWCAERAVSVRTFCTGQALSELVGMSNELKHLQPILDADLEAIRAATRLAPSPSATAWLLQQQIKPGHLKAALESAAAIDAADPQSRQVLYVFQTLHALPTPAPDFTRTDLAALSAQATRLKYWEMLAWAEWPLQRPGSMGTWLSSPSDEPALLAERVMRFVWMDNARRLLVNGHLRADDVAALTAVAPKLPAEVKGLLLQHLLLENLAPGGMKAFIDDCQRSEVPLFRQSNGAMGAMYAITSTDWGQRLRENGRIRPADLDAIEAAAQVAKASPERFAREDANAVLGFVFTQRRH